MKTCRLVLNFNGIIVALYCVIFQGLSEKINSSGCGRSDPQARIVNGKEATKKEIPWIVSIESYFPQTNAMTFCGGSIISPSFILSAAHCFILKGDSHGPVPISVYYNSTKRAYGENLQVEHFSTHPKFKLLDKRTYGYDIAVLKLRLPLTFDGFVRPVCLPQQRWNVLGRTLMISGWGYTKSGSHSDVLLRATTSGITFEECNRRATVHKEGYRESTAICAEPLGGQICQGDSGGPVTTRQSDGRSVLLGIIHGTPSCNYPNSIAIFIRVSAFLPWIEKEMQRSGRSVVQTQTMRQVDKKTSTAEQVEETPSTEHSREQTTETVHSVEQATSEQSLADTRTSQQLAEC